MIKLKFNIKDTFSGSDPVFNQISDAVLEHAGKENKYNFYISIPYNHGGEVEVMRRLLQLIETTAMTYKNIFFELRFGGFAISAAAFLFLYFSYYTLLPRVKVSSGVRLCIVYHKPRTKWKKGTREVLVFANKQQHLTLLNNKELQDLQKYTKEFDDILDYFIKTVEQTGTVVDQHLKDSYNSNGDMSFTFSPKTYKSYSLSGG